MSAIDIRKLKESIDVLLDHIIDSGVERLDIETQYYWQVEESREYDFQRQPEGYAVGDFYEDMGTREQVLSSKDNVLAYTLTELAPIVAYVGKAAGRKLAPTGG